MSEQQTQRGKLRRVENLPGESSYELLARSLMLARGVPLAEVIELIEDWGWKSALSEACCDYPEGPQYLELNGVLYEVLEEERLDYGFSEARRLPDGTIEYFASWYNGGASLSEVLANPVAKLESNTP